MTDLTDRSPTDRDAADAFSFVHDGRTFSCAVEASPARARGDWWWFAVSTEANQRHAPFRADAADTHDDVRARVVAYHDALLARRAAPYTPYQSYRPRPAAVTPAPPAPAA